jgi:hypothetical protein
MRAINTTDVLESPHNPDNILLFKLLFSVHTLIDYNLEVDKCIIVRNIPAELYRSMFITVTMAVSLVLLRLRRTCYIEKTFFINS